MRGQFDHSKVPPPDRGSDLVETDAEGPGLLLLALVVMLRPGAATSRRGRFRGHAAAAAAEPHPESADEAAAGRDHPVS